jgi:hypothetical protein
MTYITWHLAQGRGNRNDATQQKELLDMDMSKSRFRTKWSHPVNGTYKCHVAQEPVGVMGMGLK